MKSNIGQNGAWNRIIRDHLEKEQKASKNQRIRKSRNESITFRLDSRLLNKLRQEAGEKDISLNTLVNQSIRNHVDWHSIASRAGIVTIRRSLILKLLDKLTDEEIISISQNTAKTTNRDLLLIFRNRIDVKSALDFIESWLRISDIPYRHETFEGFRHSLIIQHGMGRKWSLYLGELYRHLFDYCKVNKFSYDAGQNILTFVFEIE